MPDAPPGIDITPSHILALHRALGANKTRPRKLPNRVVNEIDNVRVADVDDGDFVATDAKCAGAVLDELVSPRTAADGPGAAVPDVVRDLLAVAHRRRAAARHVVKVRWAAVIGGVVTLGKYDVRVWACGGGLGRWSCGYRCGQEGDSRDGLEELHFDV